MIFVLLKPLPPTHTQVLLALPLSIGQCNTGSTGIPAAMDSDDDEEKEKERESGKLAADLAKKLAQAEKRAEDSLKS